MMNIKKKKSRIDFLISFKMLATLILSYSIFVLGLNFSMIIFISPSIFTKLLMDFWKLNNLLSISVFFFSSPRYLLTNLDKQV